MDEKERKGEKRVCDGLIPKCIQINASYKYEIQKSRWYGTHASLTHPLFLCPSLILILLFWFWLVFTNWAVSNGKSIWHVIFAIPNPFHFTLKSIFYLFLFVVNLLLNIGIGMVNIFTNINSNLFLIWWLGHSLSLF